MIRLSTAAAAQLGLAGLQYPPRPDRNPGAPGPKRRPATRRWLPPEKAVQLACLQLLRLRGITAWRNNAGGIKVGALFVRLSPPGTPDILGYLPGGRMLAVEVKRADGRVRPAQSAWLADAAEAGVACCVVRSVDELDAWLRTAAR